MCHACRAAVILYPNTPIIAGTLCSQKALYYRCPDRVKVPVGLIIRQCTYMLYDYSPSSSGKPASRLGREAT